MPENTPAPAAPKPIPKPVKARLIRIPRDGKRFPAAIIKGDVPDKGKKLQINVGGTAYEGIVHDSTEVDGEVIVEFRNGLSPAK